MYREDEKMKNMDDSYIELLPDAPSLIESTRSIGYTLEAAIADIIDNSITAGATCVDIDYMPTPDPYIAIIDNGCGMAGAEFTQAMQFGSRNPNDSRSQGDLGRFGLGLKTASLSQCRCLTVISKCDGRIEGRQWNIDDVVARKTWALKCLNEAKCRSDYHFCEKLSDSPSGTIVLWQKFDRLMAGESNIESAMSKKMDSGAMVPRSIRNVLFTRMRNVASNYLYKLRRLVPVSSMVADGDSEAEQAKAEPSFWPCYAIDVLPHSLWESAGSEGCSVVSLMPWAGVERVVAANF